MLSLNRTKQKRHEIRHDLRWDGRKHAGSEKKTSEIPEDSEGFECVLVKRYPRQDSNLRPQL